MGRMKAGGGKKERRRWKVEREADSGVWERRQKVGIKKAGGEKKKAAVGKKN